MAEVGLDLPAEVVCSHREASPVLCPPETSLEFKQPYCLSALGWGIIDEIHRAITTTVKFLARRIHSAVLTVLAAVAVQPPCRILQVMDQSLLSHDSSTTAATRCSINGTWYERDDRYEGANRQSGSSTVDPYLGYEQRPCVPSTNARRPWKRTKGENHPVSYHFSDWRTLLVEV